MKLGYIRRYPLHHLRIPGITGGNMDPYREIKYGNPPIVEVVAEFRFVPSEPWDLTVPGLVYDRLREQFPRRRVSKVLEAETSAETAGIHQALRLEDRMQFAREDEKAIVQVGPDLLVVNHLAPYSTWKEFVPLIRQGFESYQAVTRSKGLRRIGLRYINRIEVLGSSIELSDYLNFRPHLGPALPQLVSGFVLGIQSAFDDGRDLLRLQLNSTEPDTPDSIAAILDLDYFLAQPAGVPLHAAFDWLEAAHLRIQGVFEGCLTDKLRSLFS